jgi:cell division protein ZipA
VSAVGVPLMSELRWALLILGIVFIAVLVWWERRRPRQASGALERAGSRESGAEGLPRLVRDPPLTLPEVRLREPVALMELPVAAALPEESAVPVLEPAAEPMVEDDPAPPADSAGPNADSAVPSGPDAPLARDTLPELPGAEPLVVDWPAEHERRILALRLVAPQRERFAGRSLRQALAAEGFSLGQFAIFHKPDDERRAVLSAASLTRPGTFDRETMDSQHYGGLSLFAVLPGPKSPPQAFDELVFAARNLNERLHGVLQDEQGTPLTPVRIAQLREQLRLGADS